MIQFKIDVGGGYTKEELEAVFSTNFGARIKGITLRRDADAAPYAIIFSRADGPYSDRVEGDSFFYDGEGRDKDQSLTAANKALVESNTTSRTIYGFRQEVAGGLWHYLGILNVLDHSYIRKNGFMTYEFHLSVQPASPLELKEAEAEFDDAVTRIPVLTQEARKVTAQQTARNAAFSKNVKKAYDNTCAFCGKRRISVSGYPEVEAAHIYPKEKDGADDYRNGIALCKLHHWAFDSGLMALSDDLKIIVLENIKDDSDYDEIYRCSDQRLRLPKNHMIMPHAIFVSAHRELHGFNDQESGLSRELPL